MRWKCFCSYDGTDFNGWQSQPHRNTIQDVIEHRLGMIFEHPVRIHGCGRTDSGVHAREYCFHFDSEWSHGTDALIRALRCGIPKTIQIYSAEQVPFDFHARYSITSKQYRYYFLEGYPSPFQYRYVYGLGRRRLNTDKMHECAQLLIGTHDFQNFGALHDDSDNERTIKTIARMECIRENNMITFITEGSGYLYKMVRIIAGCLLQVGLGNRPSSFVADGLVNDSSYGNLLRKECAPACGLFLDKVKY